MNKKTWLAVTIIVLAGVGVLVFWLWPKGPHSQTGSSGGEYLILYGRNDNVISSSGATIPADLLPAQINLPQSDCKQFSLNHFLGGGLIERNGSNNKILPVSGYPMSFLHSQAYSDYFYIATEQDPVAKKFGIQTIDWEIAGQRVFSAPFAGAPSQEIEPPDSAKFPGALKASPDNKYLVYPWSRRSAQQFSTGKVDPFLSDSSLTIYEVATGQKKTVLADQYNRALFTDFADFSSDGKSFFTIRRQNDSFEFVRVNLASGQIQSFAEIFPDFNWSQIKWADFFSQDGNFQATKFAISPDEKMIMVYRTYSKSLDLSNLCSPQATHKLWAINIASDQISLYSEGDNMIGGLTWDPTGQQFAYYDTTTGGCFPDYIDSHIYKMDRSGSPKVELGSYAKHKINSLSWSPDGREIVFGIYGTDFVGWLKSIDPQTKKELNIISTLETEGKVQLDKPVTLEMVDWVKK